MLCLETIAPETLEPAIEVNGVRLAGVREC